MAEILVVASAEFLTRVYTRLFNQLGYATKIATSSLEARQAIERGGIDWVVTAAGVDGLNEEPMQSSGLKIIEAANEKGIGGILMGIAREPDTRAYDAWVQRLNPKNSFHKPNDHFGILKATYEALSPAYVLAAAKQKA